MSDGISCSIQGDDIYYAMTLPFPPHKGDILALGSLSQGRVPISQVLVSRVEWVMVQQSQMVHLWITVRRINVKAHP